MKAVEKYDPLIMAGSFVLILLGFFVSFKIPNALLPEIDRPQIVLETTWSRKTAAEIEQTLIAPLEQQLATFPYLKETQSYVYNGGAWTELNFHLDADMGEAYIELLSRINQVPGWPAQVSPPKIYNYSNGAGATLASFFLYGEGEVDKVALINAYKAYVAPAFSKISGIASIKIGTPIEQKVVIEFDPALLIQYSLTQQQIISALNELVDRSGGSIKMGSKEYGLQFNGQLAVNEIENLAIAAKQQHIIRLGDIASVHTRLVTDWDFLAFEGNQSLYFSLKPSEKVNVLDTLELIKKSMSELNSGPLGDLKIKLAISRDDSIAITNALSLVYGGLLFGIGLACVVLYWYLRDLRSVFLVFLSIPVCLALVLICMYVADRSLNVISLAGMALSVGLLLDAAIVVIENIQRLRINGEGHKESITKGINEVKGALFSSTLSSVIVFIPVLLMRSTEGQLFKDLAFSISSALLASILFAILILPALARYLLKTTTQRANRQQDSVDENIEPVTMKLVLPARKRFWTFIVLLIGLPIALIVTYISIPAVDILPNPKQNIVRTYIYFDEPLSMDVIEQEVAQIVIDRIKQQQASIELPIRTHGILCYPSMCNLYFYTEGDWQFSTFKAWIENNIVNDLVGYQISIRQGGLLRFAMPDHGVSQLDIKGANLVSLQNVGIRLLTYLRNTFPGAQIDEETSLSNHSAQIEFEPKQDQLVYLGLTRSELNRHLQVLTDGLYLGNFYTGTESVSFYFKGKNPTHLDMLLDTEILVPNHGLIPLRQLTDAEITLAPESLLRVNGEVTVSLNLAPPEGVAMGNFIGQVKESVNQFMVNEDQKLSVSFRGSANNLNEFLQEFIQIFIAALMILTLLMRLTLKSWRLALAVILSMPLAIMGGMLNLQLLNLFSPQNLDVITIIGFVILMGLVINNAILLASHFQSGQQKGLTQFSAIVDAVNARKRPIYMSTLTSIFGMLPLMLNSAGSAEIYRGLAAVIVGGMVFSALFSISFMSALLSLPIYARKPTKLNNKDSDILLKPEG